MQLGLEIGDNLRVALIVVALVYCVARTFWTLIIGAKL